MAKIVIFGTGDIAQLAHYYFAHDSNHQIVAFTVDEEYKKEDIFCNLPVIGFSDITKNYPPIDYKIFIAVSYAKLNQIRTAKYLEAKQKGYQIASYISSKATIFDNVKIGENCFILENNTIQPFAKIGNNVTLWSGNHIGHHSKIQDNCFITSHVVISGGVTVKNNTFIGVNSTIRDHITIGSECVIGAGSLILQDTKDKGVYTAKPARCSSVPSDRLRKI